MSFLTGYMRTYGFSRHTLFLLVRMRFRFGLLLSTTRQRDGQSPTEMTVGSVEKDLGVRDTTPSWCVMRECGLEPLQFNRFCMAMRCTIL
jgi:hypothetical protein